MNCKSHHSQVLVIGTIHQRHNINENYSYEHILNILETFNPDVICVEIRPQEFRKKPYLKEMVLASIYGLESGKMVYPIDWWSSSEDGGSNAREERKKYMETPEYLEKKEMHDELTETSSIIQSFYEKYGEWKDYSREQGHSFFNGREFNAFKSEAYGISMQVYGDHSMNLYWQTRNLNMFIRIKKVIEENKGKRVIILTGADHKYFFDKELEKLREVDVVEFSSILPLDSFSDNDDLNIYYAKGLVKQYFDLSSGEEIESTFRPTLTPFVHGPNMDFKPEIIPRTNIDAAKIILDEWHKKQPESILLEFELGWYYFLISNYDKALSCFEHVLPAMDEIDSEFYRNFTKGNIYRNIGFCYDLLGEREKAVESYIYGEQLMEQLGKSKKSIKALYSDYKHKPFQWPEKDH
jgi:tetratricopeptide (TPR) repeat protein